MTRRAPRYDFPPAPLEPGKVIRLTFPGRVRALKNNRAAHRGPSKDYLRWEEDALKVIDGMRWTRYLRLAPVSGPVHVAMRYYPPDRTRLDLDNALTSVFEALQHGHVLVDDAQVVATEARLMEPDKANPRAEVALKTHETEPGEFPWREPKKGKRKRGKP